MLSSTTIKLAGMAKAPTSNTPVPATPGQLAKSVQTQFINILKTDHNLDLIKEIVDHIGMIKRAKKIKPQEKHRLLQNYYLTLLSYAVPKMKVVEDNTDRSNPINFQINIGGTPTTSKRAKKPIKGGVNITIPTSKNKDGSFSVDNNDPTD